MGLAAKIAVALGAFAAATGIAEVLGAANLGISFGMGQVAFALTVGLLLVRY